MKKNKKGTIVQRINTIEYWLDCTIDIYDRYYMVCNDLQLKEIEELLKMPRRKFDNIKDVRKNFLYELRKPKLTHDKIDSIEYDINFFADKFKLFINNNKDLVPASDDYKKNKTEQKEKITQLYYRISGTIGSMSPFINKCEDKNYLFLYKEYSDLLDHINFVYHKIEYKFSTYGKRDDLIDEILYDK